MDVALFVVYLKYRDLDRLEEHHAAHAAWIEKEVDAGRILLAGAASTYDSGVILARAASRDALVAMLQDDPFFAAGLSTYEIVEFRARRGALRRFSENPLYLSETQLREALAEAAIP